ncbi:MAG: YbgA family protein [Acidimicrobiia bacterium]
MTTIQIAAVDSRPIKLGVSSCIIGEEVRWNGGHARQRWLTDVLGEFVEYVSVCPEVDVGMGVPRPTVRLERYGSDIRMIDPKNEVDWTAAMNRTSRRRASDMEALDLCGFVLKKGSPTCGLERVKVVHEGGGGASADGQGLFAAALVHRFPFLPIEEEGRLNDPSIRENFIERVFAYRRLKDLFRPRWTVGNVVEFHTREKLLLRAHDETRYRELGRLVATAKSIPRGAFKDDYMDRYMETLGRRSTIAKHVNVLQHMVGFLRRVDDEAGRKEMQGAIEDFRAGLVPLIVPTTLIRHLATRHDQQILLQSSYLNPHPKELMLRNHA